MTPRDFCYWLRGYFELESGGGLTPDQIKCIKDHLDLVIKKVVEIKNSDPLGEILKAPLPSRRPEDLIC